MNDQLYPIAALLKNAADLIEFRIRWLLGKDRQELPRPNDRFELKVRLLTSNQFLCADGTFGNPGEIHTINVAPKKFAMIDPPRSTLPLPTDISRTWKVARKPNTPVDCGPTLFENLTDGVGVCHILSETQRSRIQARVERLLKVHVDRAVQNIATRSKLAAFSTDQITHNALRELSTLIVRRGLRPIYLPQVLRKEYSLLLQRTTVSPNEEFHVNRPNAFGGASLASQWMSAIIAFEVLADRSLVQALDDIVTPPEQLRQQIRVRALQGGNLIDFWCSPDVNSPVCNNIDLGQAYPASELIGTGLTIGCFPQLEVEKWIDGLRPGQKVLAVTVKHIRYIEPDEITDGGGQVIEVVTEEDIAFEPGDFPILTKDVRLALDVGSSLPPAAPRDASINYDLLQTNPGTENDPVQLGYVTGGAHVEINITPGDQDTFNKTIFGFNVYGMWEDTNTKKFFTNPSLAPTIQELRPFLITRKYSYMRDLQGPFHFNAVVHPALLRELSNPAWQPILRRPDQVTNSDPAMADEAPPDVFRFTNDDTPLPQTRFNLDLRVGMDSGIEGGVRRFILWDRDAPIRTGWSPMQSRDGSDVSAPQRYRFWVTAVDAFEQESAPVVVAAADLEAGQEPTTLFSPRIRASLLPPPAGDALENRSARTLSLRVEANGSFTITAEWETPFLNDIGIRQDAQLRQRRARKEDLIGAVKLFRRRLRRKIEEPQALVKPYAVSGAFSLPQWVAAINEILPQGWTECGSADDVLPPPDGEIWSRAFPFGHGDRGFEYLALVGIMVRADRAVFWMPDVHRRKAFAAVKQGGTWHSVPGDVVETPRSTAVVSTDGWRGADGTLHPGVLPVPNPARPRGVLLLSAELQHASAVLPVPSVSRDAVLMRLLALGVGTAKPLQREPWADTGVSMTLAQIAMLESALERASAETGIVNVATAPQLFAARRILAAELVAQTDSHAYRQNLAIGFRGLALLHWKYETFASSQPLPDEAEAEKIRIFAVRVPQDERAWRQFATVTTKALRSGDSWELSEISHIPGLRAIEEFQQPALVRIDCDDGNSSWGVVAQLITDDSDKKWLQVAGTNVLCAERAMISLFIAQPLLERVIETLDMVVTDAVYLPVGGGHAEIFAYWIQTVSAQGRVSSHSRTPFFFFPAPGTIEPSVPLGFHVNLPPDSSTDFALDPGLTRDFLPREVGTKDIAQHNPRVVLTWDAYDNDESVGIEIERQERLVDDISTHMSTSREVDTPWLAILSIAALEDDGLIDPQWVNTLRRTWLLGIPIDVPTDWDGIQSSLIPASLARRLSGAEGLKKVIFPGIGITQPAFIDYFRNVGNVVSAMDGNYEYRYRIRAWIDVLAGADSPTQFEPNRRILRGSSTKWSEWIAPEPTAALIHADEEVVLTEHPCETPAVRLKLISSAGSSIASTAIRAKQDIGGWFYRVTVKRKLDFALRSTENTTLQPGWVEIGTPLEVWPGGEVTELQDLQLDRSEVTSPITVTYWLTTRQIIRTHSRGERLVRSLPDTELRIIIPAPRNPEGKELMVTKVVRIL